MAGEQRHGRRHPRLAVVAALGILVSFGMPGLTLGQEDPMKLALLPVEQPGSFFDLTMRPGEARTLEVELANHGHAAITARTYAADVYTIVNGGFGGRLRDEPATDTTRWLDYPTDVLHMPVGWSTHRSFSVTVPTDAGPGEYITSLVLENDQPIERGGASDVGQIIRQAVAVVVTVPGQRSPAVEIGRASHEVVAGKSILSVAVQNSGNVRLKPVVELELLDRDGNRVSRATVQMDSFYALTDTFVELPLAQLLLPGDYEIRFLIEDAAEGAQATGTISFSVEGLPGDVPAEGVVPGLTNVAQVAEGQLPLLVVVALVAAALALGAATMSVVRRHRPVGQTR